MKHDTFINALTTEKRIIFTLLLLVSISYHNIKDSILSITSTHTHAASTMQIILLLYIVSYYSAFTAPVEGEDHAHDHHHHHHHIGNICDDPFHAFLCEKSKGRKIHTGKLPANFNNAIRSQIREESKVLPQFITTPVNIAPIKAEIPREESLLLPQFITTTTVKTTTVSEAELPAASFNSPTIVQGIYNEPAQQQIVNVRTEPEHYKGQDPCNHAFHSYLCQPSKGTRRRNRVFSQSSQNLAIVRTTEKSVDAAPSFVFTKYEPLKCQNGYYNKNGVCTKIVEESLLLPNYRTTLPPVVYTTQALTTTTEEVKVPEASFDSPSIIRPSNIIPAVVNKPLITAPQQIVNVRTEPEHYKGQDPCNHAFHSYLCQPSKGARRRNYGRARIPVAQIKPVQYTTTTERIVEPAPSFVFSNYSPPQQTEIQCKSGFFNKNGKCIEIAEESILLPNYRTTTQSPPPVIYTTPRTTKAPIIYTTRITTTTTEEVKIPEASFDSPSIIRPSNIIPAVVNKPLITAPQQIVNVRTEPEHYKGQDPCNHAFHSYLCQPSKGARRRNYGRARIPQPESSQNIPVKLTTTEKPIVPAPSFVYTNIAPPEIKCGVGFTSINNKCIKNKPVIEESLLLPNYRTTQPPPTTTTTIAPPTTSTTELPTIQEIPEATFEDIQIAPANQNILTKTPDHHHDAHHHHHHHEHHTLEELCNHPFHAFLCTKPLKVRKPIRIK